MTRPPKVLVVCTANQCRSPMVVALLERRLGEAGIEVEISSAGVMEGGRPAAPRAIAALEERGVALGDHVSRRLEPGDLRDADLVLGMTREHVREALAMDSEVFGRVFTLKELVRGAEESPRAGQSLDAWLAELAEQRTRRELLGSSTADDLADPMGGSKRRFRATATEIDDLVTRLVRVAWP